MTEYIEQYKEWLKTHKPDIAEASLRKLDKGIAELNRYLRARDKKAAVGVYGQSQSGKSYLVDSLLSRGDNPITIPGLGTFRNLIPQIHAESTAVTCRFTLANTNNVPEGYYLCELLSLGELIHIFLAGFDEFSHGVGYVNNVVSQLDGFTLTGNGKQIERPHVYDMIYYTTNENLPGDRIASPIIQKKLRDILEQSLNSGLSFDDLKNISKIVFGSVQLYSDFILEIINLYESIDHGRKMLVPAALIKDFINTNTILKWNSPEGVRIGFNQSEDGYLTHKTGPFNLATLQIACAELILPVENSEQVFLNRVDLLDFPGLRPFQEGGETNTSAQNVAKVLKQGKLKATFDLYCKRKEIPALIVASPWENAAASSLPGKIVNWLDEYCSPDFAVNANRLLFFAMTKSDYLLSDNWRDNITERLDSRFRAHYEIEFHSMLSTFGGQIFNNIYFTINPDFSSFDNNQESLNEARNIFINDVHVNRLLGNQADEMFNTYTDPGAGARRLVDNINLLANDLNNVKQRNITDGITKQLQDLLRDMDLHIHDEDEVREQQLNKRRLVNFVQVIRFGMLRNELINYFDYCYPNEWEWSENREADDVAGITVDDLFGNTEVIDMDEIFDLANTTVRNNYLSDLLGKYQANLEKNYTPNILRHTHQHNAENHVMYYIQACINYFNNSDTFRETVESFASIRATLDPDSAVPISQFNDAIKNCIISHCTGFMYNAAFETPDIQRKIAKGLFKAAEISFQTRTGFDIEANEKIKSIRNNIQNHVPVIQ